MCGITGFYLPRPNADHFAHRMTAGGLLVHRGPDDFGNWINPEQTFGIQHYRLAIVDTSKAGAQPMHSPDGRWVIAFNGEIYNHLELREILKSENEAPVWVGQSDTETLVAAISAWGLRATLDKCVGMFALVLYDRFDKSLTLARDRIGEKPLYYGYLGGALCVASEPKALRAVNRKPLHLNSRAVVSYLQFGYVSGTESIFEGIFRVPPGALITFDINDIERQRIPAPEAYWRFNDVVKSGAAERALIDSDKLLDELDSLMSVAVSRQLASDVPVGALLSGGVDSSLVVSIMQANSDKCAKTFSIGFEDAEVDEAPWARRIAQYLGTEHTEAYLSARDTLEIIPGLPKIFCEPFADSSQVPTILLSELTKQKVTVALTGDGGDELFAGYDRYFRVDRGYKVLERVPIAFRKSASVILKGIPVDVVNSVSDFFGNPIKLKNPGDRLRKIADALPSESATEFHNCLITAWDPSTILKSDFQTDISTVFDLPDAPTLIERMMLADGLSYLPDNLLVKVDRSAMSVGLECRNPFLDHAVVEFAWKLNLEQKVSNGIGKLPLKNLLNRYLPSDLFERPKQGFGMPIGQWLRGPLRDWAIDLVGYCSARNGFDILNHQSINRVLNEHLTGKRNWEHKLWVILMFIAWVENENEVY